MPKAAVSSVGVGKAQTVHDLDPEKMTQTLLSFAHSSITPPADMLKSLFKRILLKLPEFKPREIVLP
jgi:hypothetical protein